MYRYVLINRFEVGLLVVTIEGLKDHYCEG